MSQSEMVNLVMSNPNHRSGRELWRIARKLIMAVVKGDKNMAFNVIKSVREKKAIQQKEAIKRRTELLNEMKLRKFN